MQDAWRAYLEMALGLTEAPRKRAQKVADDLVNRGGATAAQLQGLVEDLMSTGMANREALTNIVRYEVDRALGKVGLATADEVEDLTTRVRDLERQLRAAQGRADASAGSSGTLIAAGAAASGGGIGGDRLNQPAPLPGKVAKKAVTKKAVKAPPNAMPKAASPRPAQSGGAAGPGAAAKKVTGPSAPDAGPVRMTQPPAGTAAAATKLPPTALAPTVGTMSSVPAKKTAARKATAKKASPAADAAPAKKAGPAKAGRAKKAAPAPDTGVTQPEA